MDSGMEISDKVCYTITNDKHTLGTKGGIRGWYKGFVRFVIR